MTQKTKINWVLTGCCFLILWILMLTYFVFSNLHQTHQLAASFDFDKDGNQQIEVLDKKLIALSEQILAAHDMISSLQKADKDIQEKQQQNIDAIYVHLGQYAQLSDMVLILEKLDQHQNNIQELLASQVKAAAQSASAIAPSPTAKPQASRSHSSIPFKVIGMDLRGGESLLTVMPSGKNTIGSIQFLRVGQQVGNWTLQSTNEREAIFKVGSQTRRLSIPQ